MTINFPRFGSLLRFGIISALSGSAIIASTGQANAQTQPPAQPLPFSLTSATGATLPAGVAVHRFGITPANVPTTPILIPATQDANAASGNAGGYNGEGANGISLLASNSSALGALVVAIDTTNKTKIKLGFTARVILQQASRDCALDVQYRVGTTGDFTRLNQTFDSAGKLALASQDFSGINLPAAAENQPVVQVRFLYYESSTGLTGSRDRLAVDEISISGQTGTGPTNSSPVFSSLTIAPLNPTTKSTLIATPTATDADNDTLSYSYVWQKNGNTIAGVTGPSLDLSVASYGDKNDQITVTGTVSDGKGGTDSRTSAAVTIQNSPPVVSNVTIDQSSANTNSTLSFTVGTTTDDDAADTLTSTYQWKKNSQNIGGQTGPTLDLSVVGNGDDGDSISVVVTVSDGTTTSSSESNSITIATPPTNNAPIVTGVSISPTNPTTNTLLTATPVASDPDNDPLTYSYVWKKDGNVISGQIGPKLDLSITGNGDKGETISVIVTASDGIASTSSNESTGVTIENSAPVVGGVSISPTNPKTKTLLTATPVASDADGDPLILTYVWKKNGSVIAGQTGATLDLSIPSYGDKGETISVILTANDGTTSTTSTESAGVTIENSAPVVSGVGISPTNPTTNTLLTANATTTDDDGDSLTLSYVWKKNSQVISGQNGPTLDLSVAGNGSKGQTISVIVTANDGTTSTSSASAGVTIGNSAPVVSSVSISPTNPTTNTLLTATVAASDADGDTLTYSYVWRKNGNVISGQTGSTLDLSVAGNGDEEDSIDVSVQASDGTDSSVFVTSASVSIDIINVTPTVVSVTPSSASDNVGDTRTFTVTVNDGNGVKNIKNVWFLANTVLDWSDGATLVYDKVNNQLFLRDNDHFNGPITPGSGTLSNGAVTIAGSSVVVTPQANGTTLAITFALQVKNGMVGTNGVWGRVEDLAGTTDQSANSGQFGFVQKATWRVSGTKGTQVAPVAAVSPGARGTSTPETVGSEFNVTLDLTDANGLGDIQSGYVLINDKESLSWANGFTLYYEARTNRLYLRSTDGNSFLGGFVVGQSTGTLENEAGSIRLSGCTMTPITNGVRLVIAVTPKSALAGTKQVWTRIQDLVGNVAADSNATFGFKTEGLLVISNAQEAKPSASVAIAGTAAGKGTSHTVATATETTFTLNLTDADGAGELKSGWLLINQPGVLDWTNCIALVYEARNNVLRLRSTDGSRFSDAVLGTTTGTLSNGAVSIRLSGTSVTRTAQGITLTLAVTPKASFTGTKQIWSRVEDSVGNVQANHDADLGFNTEGTVVFTVPGQAGSAPSGGSAGVS
ncbi:hypothetical protein IAD21_02497 [Abditibacteriota bacterium]|nr:hypothetical protein IAD21_02497 [Abditibacteriota bacterium]